MQIIGAGNTWYRHHGNQMTTSSLYFLSKGFFSPALRADATANRSKGIEEKAEAFTEIKTQLELLYSFPSHFLWVQFLISPTTSNYFLTASFLQRAGWRESLCVFILNLTMVFGEQTVLAFHD